MYLGKDAFKTQLGRLFENRKTNGKQGLPVLSVTMDSGLVLRKSLDRKMAPDLAPEESLLVEPGDIVYNMMRMWQGAVGVSNQRGVVSPAYVVCKPKYDVDSSFACYFFKAHPILHRLKSYSFGITGDRLRLYFKDFAAIPVSIPPVSMQKEIVKIISTWDDAIEQTGKLIQAQSYRKKALLENLLSGNKRLPEFRGPWRECTVADLCGLRGERYNPSARKEGLISVELEHIESKSGHLIGTASVSSEACSKNRFYEGDVLFGKLRPYLRKFIMARFNGVCSSEIWVLTHFPKKHSFKISFLLSSNRAIHYGSLC